MENKITYRSLMFVLVAGLILWPLMLHTAFDILITRYNYEAEVGFPIYGVIHYFLAFLLGITVYAIASTHMTLKGLIVTMLASMVFGPASLFLGLTSETLTNIVVISMLILLFALIAKKRSVFRHCVFFLCGVLITVQLIHHASMTFGPYKEDNQRIKVLLSESVRSVRHLKYDHNSACLYEGELLDHCKSFPDQFSSGFTTSPPLLEIMEAMRNRWQETGEVQYGHYRFNKELSSQWALRFDGRNWVVAHKHNRFLINVYAPVLAWLFAWAVFWWSLTFLGLAVWHEQTPREQLRMKARHLKSGFVGLIALHVGHYVLLALFSASLIPTTLLMSAERRLLLEQEFQGWFAVMAVAQLLGALMLIGIIAFFHWSLRKRKTQSL